MKLLQYAVPYLTFNNFYVFENTDIVSHPCLLTVNLRDIGKSHAQIENI